MFLERFDYIDKIIADKNLNYTKKINTFFVPTDFYFEIDLEEKIYNPIIKDDLNVFLSLLN